MDDEKYTFFEDVKEKAITARSAKKRASRGGCIFPRRTAKELQKMNGPTHTINLKKAIPYADFKVLPEDLQKEYIKNIIDRYHVGPSAIAELMGANAKAVGAYLSVRGFSFKRGFQPTKEDLERFRADYGINANADGERISLQSLSFSFFGAFEPTSFARQLRRFIPEGRSLRVSVTVEVVASEQSAT